MSEADVLPAFGDIGARLRGARERSGMTVAQAAERLHCDRDLIESMEAGRFAHIGAPVFVRGHLRRYAELLGEPVGEVLELWEREAAGHVAPPDITQIPKAKRPPDTRRLLLPAAVAALVALFVLLVYWVLRDSTLPEIGGFVAGPSADPAAEVVEPVPAAAAEPVAVAGAPGSAPAADDAAGDASAPAATAPTAATGAAESAPPPQTGALRIRAASDCWIEIYDTDRRRLYFNLLPADRSTTVRGRMPLRVLLGNVRGVTLDLDGRRVSVPAELQRANTARVLLDADGVLRAAPRD